MAFLFIRYIIRIEYLRAFHKAALCGREGFAAMHGGPVVPHDEVADMPCVGPGEFRAGGMFAERIEQGIAFSGGHVEDIFCEVSSNV